MGPLPIWSRRGRNARVSLAMGRKIWSSLLNDIKMLELVGVKTGNAHTV